jgi:hypothetical protein
MNIEKAGGNAKFSNQGWTAYSIKKYEIDIEITGRGGSFAASKSWFSRCR